MPPILWTKFVLTLWKLLGEWMIFWDWFSLQIACSYHEKRQLLPFITWIRGHEKYQACARACYDQSLVFFNLTPKVHYLFHVSDDTKKQLLVNDLQCILNPALFSTQMAEDYIGKTCRVAKTVHPCTAAFRTAQKWLVVTKQVWDDNDSR